MLNATRRTASNTNTMSTYYAVLRLDRKMIGKDMFGRDVPYELPEGQYAMPVFDSREAADEYADGRHDVITLFTADKPENDHEAPHHT